MIYQVTIPILPKLQDQTAAGGFEIIKDLGVYTSSIVSMFLIVAGVATFIYLAYGGITWIMSGNDTQKTEEARSRITNALIGLAIVACSWAVFLLLDYFFGLGIVSSTNPPPSPAPRPPYTPI